MPTQKPTLRKGSKRDDSPRPKWRDLVRWTLKELGGEANLQTIYTFLEHGVPRTWLTPTWKAKVRQQLQLDPMTLSIDRGVWQLQSRDS